MNSDFMQIESEKLAQRVAAEPDNTARTKKLYRIIYNREPTEPELKLAVDYLHSEPMQEFEEVKNKPKETASEGMQKATESADGTPAADDETTPPPAGAMMAGIPGYDRPGPKKPAAPTPKYTATPWGRYAKILLSSSEFLYID